MGTPYAILEAYLINTHAPKSVLHALRDLHEYIDLLEETNEQDTDELNCLRHAIKRALDFFSSHQAYEKQADRLLERALAGYDALGNKIYEPRELAK